MTEQFPALHADWRKDNGRHKGQVARVLLHTTEGSTVAGAQAAYDGARGSIHPHVTYDPRTRHGVQHVTVHRASASLKSRTWPWPHSYNRDGVFQVECVGFARTTPTYSNQWYENLVMDVLDPLFDLAPGIHWWNFAAPFLGPSAYGTAAPQRFSMQKWLGFNGVIGHQHAPKPNAHWDPGAIRVDTLAQAIVDVREPEPLPPSPPPPPEEDMTPEESKQLAEMYRLLTNKDKGQVATYDMITRKFAATFKWFRELGVDHAEDDED